MSKSPSKKPKKSPIDSVAEPDAPYRYLPARRRVEISALADVAAIPADFQLTPEFSCALDLMEKSNKHLYITGNAGTGKSTLLHYFKQKTQKETVVVAPTGVAAINVGGATIHSFFRFPPRFLSPKDIRVIRKKQELFDSLETLVIDEVSMVRADIMDAIDRSLRINRGRLGVPFGGVQMILIGDLHQLPPVVEEGLTDYFNDNFQSPFFFSAGIFKQVPLTQVELKHIFRQSDPEFIALLNNVRHKRITPYDLELLNRSYDSQETFSEDDLAITLTSTNALAARINEAHLNALEGRDYWFDAVVEGKFDEGSFPTEQRLRLREGAQVMMVRNDINKQWVNGSLGIVQKLSKDSITVSFDGKECTIDPSTWEKIDYKYNRESREIEPDPIGSFKQFPIKLAWAITIHKSQGKTFDKVIIDLGYGAFAHGQAYVALSRCRTLEGIRLRRPVRLSDIILDERVKQFHASGKS